jgi:hypothetical protein
MPQTQSLNARAEADIAFVRDVLTRSQQFSAVPGLGGVLMGASALVAAGIATIQPTRDRWLAVWLLDAVVAVAIGAFTLVRKARRSGLPLSASPARRFALGLMPPIFVGGLLTFGARQANAWDLIAPIWLCCYGVGVLGAGAVSTVPVVIVLGGTFVGLGALALATPSAWATAWLALGFGVAHLISGVIVMRRHGG